MSNAADQALSRTPSVTGPSLRQDIPRPPLRRLALRARRNGVLAWQRGRERWQAALRDLQRDLPRRQRVLGWRAQRSIRRMTAAAVTTLDAGWQAAQRALETAAHTIEPVIARLDAHVWQPAMWPFRPAQREILARSLATLSVACVALTWVVAYSTLTPPQAVRPAAPPPAPPKQFTERVVSRALPVAVPKAEAPSVPVADARHDMAHGLPPNLARAAEPPRASAPSPAPKARRATARNTAKHRR